MSRHLLVAHGSPDPRHAAFVRSLATGVSAHGVRTEAAFLEHDLPDVATWLAGAEGQVTALSLLLAPGYHAQEDVPRLLATAPDAVRVSDLGVLGAGPWLHEVLDELVASAGGDPATPVVLVAAGSSRPAAGEHLQAFAAGWAATRPGPASVSDPAGLAEQVDRWPDAVVVPLLVAPGVLADRIARAADDLGVRVTPVLGVAGGFVGVLAARLAGREAAVA